MFYIKKLKKRETKTFLLKFDEFNSAPRFDLDGNLTNGTKNQISYNFKISNGYLQSGYGIKKLTLPTDVAKPSEQAEVVLPVNEIKAMWEFNWRSNVSNKQYYYIFFLDGENKLYYMEEWIYGVMFNDTGVTFNSIPTAFPYRNNGSNILIFSSLSDDLVVVAGSNMVYRFPDAPKMNSCCLHENVFYAVQADDDATILCTKDLNVADWKSNNMEVLELTGDGGRVRKVFSFGDYVYLFRENGIVKIYSYSTNNPLSITHIYYTANYIAHESIARCGDKFVFLAHDGFYTFNGSSVKKLDIDIAYKINLDDPTTICAKFFNGKYFLACKIDFRDGQEVGCEASANGYVNNAVVIYDLNSGEVEIMRGVDIRSFASFETYFMSKLLCSFNNDNKNKIGEFTLDGEIFGQNYQNRWTSLPSDLGYKGQKKIIKSMKITASKNCQVEIKSDIETKVLNIKGSSKTQRIVAKVKGETFSISIISNESGQKISTPEFEIEVLL